MLVLSGNVVVCGDKRAQFLSPAKTCLQSLPFSLHSPIFQQYTAARIAFKERNIEDMKKAHENGGFSALVGVIEREERGGVAVCVCVCV
jgi:hypothetical protein